MAIVRVENLEKIYSSPVEEVKALRGINLQIEKGDFIVINGPSGSGKTTLLNLISGIDQASAGEIYIDNLPLSRLSDKERTLLRKEKIGLVFQSFELLPMLTARENVEYPLLLQNISAQERRQRVEKILKNVNLLEMAERFPAQLSGGQKQRVAIARALVTRPELVLADEPTGNLDTKTSKQIIALMLRLNKEYGVAFVIVTHDLSLNQFARKLIEIRDGQLEVIRGAKNSLA